MSFSEVVFCVILLSTYTCDADILDEFPEKCSIRDGECQKNTLSALVQAASTTGIPDLGIPPLDPYEVKDTTVSVLGMVDLTMYDGLVEGTSNCTFTEYETNIDKLYTYTESFCDLIRISGRYKIEVGPLTQTLIGEPIAGDGFGFIQIEKMTLKMKIPFSIEESNDDGEIYLVPQIKAAEYSTNDIENISFGADNVVLGGREISEQLMKFMNTNWRTILRSFGKLFSDKVMDTFYVFLKEFFLTFPASKLVSDDLSVYVKH